MKRSTAWTIPLLVVALCACDPGKRGGGEASHEPDTREAGERGGAGASAEVSADDDAFAGAPEGTATIASLLAARHAEDLPDAETLAAHVNAEASLRWLATEGGGLAVRTRALMSLRFYASSETRELLLGVLVDPGTHPALRAAAITGTGGLSFDEAGELRALVEAGQTSEDPRVQKAASTRLRGADELAAP